MHTFGSSLLQTAYNVLKFDFIDLLEEIEALEFFVCNESDAFLTKHKYSNTI